jgi:hypothetical protein
MKGSEEMKTNKNYGTSTNGSTKMRKPYGEGFNQPSNQKTAQLDKANNAKKPVPYGSGLNQPSTLKTVNAAAAYERKQALDSGFKAAKKAVNKRKSSSTKATPQKIIAAENAKRSAATKPNKTFQKTIAAENAKRSAATKPSYGAGLGSGKNTSSR